MSVKWVRMNPYLGCSHEITEKQAMRKINSKWWVQHWDSYWDEPTNMWINTRDPERDVIFRREDEKI